MGGAIVILGVLLGAVALVAAVWSRGGTRVGLWTLGFVLLAAALGFAGTVVFLAELTCEGPECPQTAWDVVLVSGSGLSLLCAVALLFRVSGPARPR